MLSFLMTLLSNNWWRGQMLVILHVFSGTVSKTPAKIQVRIFPLIS